MLTGCCWHFVVRRLATTKAIHKTQASLSELHLKRIQLCRLGRVLKLKGVWRVGGVDGILATEKKGDLLDAGGLS